MNTASATITSADQSERYRVIFSGICALILSVGLARFAYTPMLPIMRDQAGLTYLAGGWLATINYAGYLSGALLAASISNLSRKFVLYRIGLVFALLGTAGMGLTDHVMVWGICCSNCRPGSGHIATATGSYHGALMITAGFMLLGVVLLKALMR